MLKQYGLTEEERNLHIQAILSQFVKEQFVKYPLDDKSYIILSKNDRKLKNLRKYDKSPFPLLTNLEAFGNTVGQLHESLLKYGIKTREKLNDNPLTPLDSLGTQIYLVYYQTTNSRGNHYLRRQYERLRKYRAGNRIKSYWKLS
jgi:hypothetical protein